MLRPEQMSLGELHTFYSLVCAAQRGGTLGLAPFRFSVPPLELSPNFDAIQSQDNSKPILSDHEEGPEGDSHSEMSVNANTSISSKKRSIDEVEADSSYEQPQTKQPPKKKQKANK